MSDWREYKLGDMAKVQTGPFGSQLHQSDYKAVGTPIITVEYLGDNSIIYSDLPLVGDEDKERLMKYTLRTGDVVFSRVGSVDRCAYVHKEEDLQQQLDQLPLLEEVLGELQRMLDKLVAPHISFGHASAIDDAHL